MELAGGFPAAACRPGRVSAGGWWPRDVAAFMNFSEWLHLISDLDSLLRGYCLTVTAGDTFSSLFAYLSDEFIDSLERVCLSLFLAGLVPSRQGLGPYLIFTSAQRG